MANASEGASGKSSQRYFLIGWAMLALMALLSGLDGAFVYIFLGAAAFCFFQGFLLRPKSQSNHTYAKGRRKSSPPRTPGSSHPKPVSEKAVAVVMVFVSIAIFIIVIVVAVNSGEDVTAEFFHQQGDYFRRSAQYDSATLYYRRALAAAPDNSEILGGYAGVLADLENFDSARYYFDRSLTIDPSNTNTRYEKGRMLLYGEKDYKETRSEARKIIDMDPQNADAYLLLGDSFYLENQYDSAIRYYESGYNFGARSGALSHVMAYIYDVKGKQSLAIEKYKEALDYDSTTVEIYQRLGELLPGTEGNYFRETALELSKQRD